jgi:hypothetical protein
MLSSSDTRILLALYHRVYWAKPPSGEIPPCYARLAYGEVIAVRTARYEYYSVGLTDGLRYRGAFAGMN